MRRPTIKEHLLITRRGWLALELTRHVYHIMLDNYRVQYAVEQYKMGFLRLLAALAPESE